MRRPAGCVLVGAVVIVAMRASGVTGQEPVDPRLAERAHAFAEAWELGDVVAVAGHMARSGIRLELTGTFHPALSLRTARAALAELHDRTGRGSVTVRRAEALGGTPPKAFLEMEWTPVPEGVSEPLPHTVFAGLELVEGEWRVVEVRVLRDGTSEHPKPATERRR